MTAMTYIAEFAICWKVFNTKKRIQFLIGIAAKVLCWEENYTVRII